MSEISMIRLNGGSISVLIDKEDLPLFETRTWFFNGRYVCSVTRKNEGKRTAILLHRFLTNCPDGMIVDHINRDPLNNTQANLRVCSRRQNARNCVILRKNNTSGYKGICFNKLRKKWQVNLKVNNRQTTIGYFESKEEAAACYDIEAVKHYGEYARLNGVCA